MLKAKNIIYGFCKYTNPPKKKYLISLYRSDDLNIIAVFPTSQRRAGVTAPKHTYYRYPHCPKDSSHCIIKDAKGKADFSNKNDLCGYCKK